MILVEDVIIVGAGPAGSTCAKTIVENSDKSVLIIERKKELGKIWACGGGWSKYWIDRLGLKIPEELITARIKRFRLFSPNKEAVFDCRDIGLEDMGYVINRAGFDKHLADQAVEAGAHILLGTKVNKTDIGGQIGTKRIGIVSLHHFPQYLVGADGAGSAVRKAIGAPPFQPADMYVAIQDTRRVPDFDQEEIWIYLNKKYAPDGYAWIFPVGGDEVRIGNGVPLSIGKPRVYLEKYYKDHPEYKGELVEVTGGLIPLALPTTVQMGNVALVGDAASQMDTLVGGGMATSMICARELGKAIAKDQIDRYDEMWRAELGTYLRRRYMIRNVLLTWGDDDIDAFVSALDGFTLKSTNFPREVARILLHAVKQRPSLVPRSIKPVLEQF